jgi:outer membrane protein with beta-barrel domain
MIHSSEHAAKKRQPDGRSWQWRCSTLAVQEVFVRRINRILTLAVIALGTLVPAVASAQTTTPWSIGVGYQLLHIPDETFPFGMNFDAAIPLVPSTSIVGEFGFATDNQDEPGVTGNLKFYTVAGGARWSMATDTAGHAVAPYVQVLIGAARTDADLVQNGVPFNAAAWAFMVQPGVGVTVPVTATIGVMGQVDYRRAFFSPESENEWRFVLGVRLFGR